MHWHPCTTWCGYDDGNRQLSDPSSSTSEKFCTCLVSLGVSWNVDCHFCDALTKSDAWWLGVYVMPSGLVCITCCSNIHTASITDLIFAQPWLERLYEHPIDVQLTVINQVDRNQWQDRRILIDRLPNSIKKLLLKIGSVVNVESRRR